MEKMIKFKNGWIWFITAGLWTVTLLLGLFTYGVNNIELFNIFYFSILGANILINLLNGIFFTTGTFGIIINGDEVILKRLSKKVIIKDDIIDISYTKKYLRNAMKIKTSSKTYYLYNDYIVDMHDLKRLIQS
jgi:hypothetical protein